MKAIAWLAGVGAFVFAAVYMIVSLNRWEWNRAFFFGLIVVIAEVGLAAGLVLRKLGQLASRPAANSQTLAALRESRPPTPDRFQWLTDSAPRTDERVHHVPRRRRRPVFWRGVGGRPARPARTATPLGERRLAGRLGLITYPVGGLVVDDVTVLAQDTPGADDAQIRRLLGRQGRGR